jgi:hypothetical protein
MQSGDNVSPRVGSLEIDHDLALLTHPELEEEIIP